jgi:hypothetical protein
MAVIDKISKKLNSKLSDGEGWILTQGSKLPPFVIYFKKDQ